MTASTYAGDMEPTELRLNYIFISYHSIFDVALENISTTLEIR